MEDDEMCFVVVGRLVLDEITVTVGLVEIKGLVLVGREVLDVRAGGVLGVALPGFVEGRAGRLGRPGRVRGGLAPPLPLGERSSS